MNLTQCILHVFRSTGKAHTIREVAEMFGYANSKSVSDIICRLERQKLLMGFRSGPVHMRSFIVSHHIDTSCHLSMLVAHLEDLLEKHGDVVVYGAKAKFQLVDAGDVNYVSIEGVK